MTDAILLIIMAVLLAGMAAEALMAGLDASALMLIGMGAIAVAVAVKELRGGNARRGDFRCSPRHQTMGAVRMNPIDSAPDHPGLSPGLSLEAVRQLLAGWKNHPIRAAKMPDGKSYCSIWDFTPPGADARPLRLAFVNQKLTAWGDPAKRR